ncbi:hypothetical protein ACFFRR_005110 [Megaselia abdita]
MEITGKENIFGRRYIHQTFATCSVNILTFSHGIGLGWITPILYNMQFNAMESMLGVTISAEVISWIGSLLAIGGLTGGFIAGIILPKIGIKRTLTVLPIPHLCFWLLTHLVKTSTPYHFYVGRVLCGICGGGCFVAIPLFISEISSPNVRGRLGSLFLVTLNTGVLFGFILAHYLRPLFIVPIFCACLLCLYYFILLTYLFDTPQYLIKIGLIDEAKKSLQFYWNSTDQKDVELDEYFDTLSQKIQTSFETINEKNETMLRTLFKTQHLKAVIIGFGLVSVNQFSGSFSIINYSTAILEQSKSFTLDLGTSTILLLLLQILGTYSATLTVDRFGRKIVLIISASCSAIGLLSAGVFDYLCYEFDVLKDYSWILILSLASVIYFANMGVCTVCFIAMVEVLPIQVRSVGTCICMVFSSAVCFTALKLFPVLIDSIGFYGVMWTFGTLTTIGLFFLIVVVPETKGKSMME